jgi:L-Ala-D/L-Glu epimerase
VRLTVERRRLRLASPLRAAYGTLAERDLLQVAITDREGLSGHGEAAPLEAYDGVGVEQVELALERYETVLAGAEQAGLNGAQILDACRELADLAPALAAIDLALWDRAGRRAGRPVAELLTDSPPPSVPVNATVTALDRAGAAEQAGAAARAGFGCVKVKVGVGDDGGRVAAVRAAAGPRVALRLDANGAFTPAEAIAAIEALSPAGLELVEEPTHGLQGVREVRERVAARVSIDETAAEPGALAAGIADAVCLKVSRCGGIAGLIAAAALVRSSNAEVYLASTLDGPLGVAAALHAAAALASRGPVPHCGLATLSLFADLEDPLPARDGSIVLPRSGGLGVDPV